MTVANFDTIAGEPVASTLHGTRILIVEDSWIVAQSLKAILELIGAGVTGPAITLEDAAELSKEGDFDVAIMDLDLQGRPANPLIADMQERGLPVIIVTAYEVPPELAEKSAAVLTKPVRAETLLSSVRQVRAESMIRH